MKFFYRLERFQGGEYVVLEVEEGEHKGTGAVVPRREKGQNYKTIMGAIEEYRHVVESAKAENFAIISARLDVHFPGHPEVRFAISSAMVELYTKLAGLSVEELLMVNDLEEPKIVTECDDPLIPEEIGGVFEVLSFRDKSCMVLREYPNSEMRGVLRALSFYFNEVIRLKM